MVTHDSEVRVRYGEVDMMGYLYHSHYVELFDLGRNNLLRSLGYTYRELEESGVMMPVLQVNIDYKKPANYDDLLTVRTAIKEMPSGARVTFHYEVLRNKNNSEELLTTGTVTLAFMDSITHRPMRPPQILVDLFSPYFTTEK